MDKKWTEKNEGSVSILPKKEEKWRKLNASLMLRIPFSGSERANGQWLVCLVFGKKMDSIFSND